MVQADAGVRTFLGAGAQFPFALTPDGALAATAYEEHVAQSVYLVLATDPGERVMRPDFGCGLRQVAFAPVDATTTAMAEHLVREGLRRCEPRIDVLAVAASAQEGRPGVLVISVEYRVRRTDTVFNLVYPFSLERGGHADA